MKVVRKESCGSRGPAVEARDEELRTAMVLLIDSFGGDGPGCAHLTNTPEELLDMVAETCFDLGRDDVLRRLADPCLSAGDRLTLLDEMIEEHFGQALPEPEPAAEEPDGKVVIGYRVKDRTPGEPPYYYIPADDNDEGFWCTESKHDALLTDRAAAEKLVEDVLEAGNKAKIVTVTKKVAR